MILKNKLIALILVFGLFLCVSTVPAEVTVPDSPSNYVVDQAGIIDNSLEEGLNRYLRELEQKTTAQMVILTIKSLEGEPLEDVSLRIAHDKWKIGQKGKDNGLLLLVSLQDRKYRFETGYGLEGLLPDSYLGSVGRQYLVPYFRKGDYSRGITAASLVIINRIAEENNVEIRGMPRLNTRSGRSGHSKPSLFSSILSVVFVIGLIYMFIKHPRLLLLLLMMNMLGGGRRSSWGSGGGFGGGGFGGGGGGFGGGGASGGW